MGQDDRFGCGVAVLAMLLGKSYQETKAYFIGMDAAVKGLHLYDVLADFGFATAKKYKWRWHEEMQEPRAIWPPEPFHDIHIAHVKVSATSPCNHYVILLGDGSVLDPLTQEPRRLTDYYQVNHVAAVTRFGESTFPAN